MGICSNDACNEDVYARGLCHKHYAELRRHGLIPGQKRCKIPDCENGAVSNNFCEKHYKQSQQEEHFCKCGCGKITRSGDFTQGHHMKVHNHRKGVCFTEEHKARLSASQKGRPGLRGKDHPNFGKSMSEEQKLKISMTKKGVPNYKAIGKKHSAERRLNYSIANSGDRHYRWIDGRSYSVYGDVWNKEYLEDIRERDNHECQCKSHNPITKINKLNVHHINFDRSNSNPQNLISLCPPCHMRAHQKNKLKLQKEFMETIHLKYGDL